MIETFDQRHAISPSLSLEFKIRHCDVTDGEYLQLLGTEYMNDT